MRSHNYSSLSDVTNFLSKNCIRVEYKDIKNESFDNETENCEDNYDFDDMEEVFSDHVLMGKRLRKTLYAGNLDDLDDPPDHPPIALTGLALEFFSKAVPNNGLDILDMDYVSCTAEAARLSPCAMIVAMIYLERLQLNNTEYLEVVSPSGLFVVTMLVASKFLFEDDDDMVTNQMWAEALNFDVKELNNLEREFLSAIDWKVLVDSSDYFKFLCKIEKNIAIKQSSVRNWLSYSDTYVMSQDPAFERFWTTCLRKFVKTVVLWTVGYVATTLALHTAGITMNKLLQDKNDLDVLTKGNATTELDTLEPGVPFHPVLSEIQSSNDEDFLVNSLESNIFRESETIDIQMNIRSINDFCKSTIYPSSSNLSRILQISKLKTSSYIDERLPINETYLLSVVHCQPNSRCFSLLI